MSKFAVIAIHFGIFIAIAQYYLLQRYDFQTRALIMRIEFVIVVQIIMLVFSRIQWKHMKNFPAELLLALEFVRRNHRSKSMSSNNFNQSFSESHLLNEERLSENIDDSLLQACLTKKYFSRWRYLLIFYFCLCHFSYFTNLFFINKEPHWLSMSAYAALGSFIQLNAGHMIFKCFNYLIRHWITKYKVSLPFIPSSTRFDKIAVSSLTLIFMILTSMYGLYSASQPPLVKDVRIPVKDLPYNLIGLKIVQLSDIHLGPTVGLTKMKMIVDIVNTQKPDVVVLTGDLTDGKAKILQQAAMPLKEIKTRHGKYFVTGNHEYYTSDVDNWFELLESLGFTVLHNSNVRIPPKLHRGESGQICLAGTDDLQADKIGYGEHRFDLNLALMSCSTDLPVVLLAHQPKAARKALDSKYRVDVILSGHTHGGQLFPMMLGAYLLNPFYAGLYREGNSHVYVSQGTQFWGIPMRIGTTMEVTSINLVPMH